MNRRISIKWLNLVLLLLIAIFVILLFISTHSETCEVLQIGKIPPPPNTEWCIHQEPWYSISQALHLDSVGIGLLVIFILTILIPSTLLINLIEGIHWLNERHKGFKRHAN